MKKNIFSVLIMLISTFSAFSQDNNKISYPLKEATLININGDSIFSFSFYDNNTPKEFPYLQYPDSDRCIIQETGKVIIIPPGSCIYAMTDFQKLFIVQTHDNGDCFGVIDDENNILVPFGKYERLEHWKDDLFFARQTKHATDGNYNHDCWGVVNTKGEVIIPFLYSYFYPFSSPLGAVRAEEPYYFCLLDENGTEHLPFQDYKQFTRRPFSVSDGIIVGYMNDMQTYDINGNIILPSSRNYQWIYPYADGYAFFQNEKGLWGVLDKAGNEVIPAVYKDAVNNYGKRSQPVIVKPHTFGNKLVCMLLNGEGYGAVDKTGKTIIPFEYYYLSPFTNSVAVAAVNRSQTYSPKLEYGIINTKGKIIVPFEYDYIGIPTNYGYAQAEKDGKRGIITINNEIIMPLNYYDIIPFTDSLFIIVSEPQRE